MKELTASEVRLIKQYNHDLDGLIDVVKVICDDAYKFGYQDGYNYGFHDGYDYRIREGH